jgi:hypothetical protein
MQPLPIWPHDVRVARRFSGLVSLVVLWNSYGANVLAVSDPEQRKRKRKRKQELIVPMMSLSLSLSWKKSQRQMERQ